MLISGKDKKATRGLSCLVSAECLIRCLGIGRYNFLIYLLAFINKNKIEEGSSMNGKGIKAVRDYLGLTQEEFSKKIGVSRSSISMIEIDRMVVNNRLKTKIAKTFDIGEDFQTITERIKALDQLRL